MTLNFFFVFFFVCIAQVYVGALSLHYEALSVEASKLTTAEEIVSCIVDRLNLSVSQFINQNCVYCVRKHLEWVPLYFTLSKGQ